MDKWINEQIYSYIIEQVDFAAAVHWEVTWCLNRQIEIIQMDRWMLLLLLTQYSFKENFWGGNLSAINSRTRWMDRQMDK